MSEEMREILTYLTGPCMHCGSEDSKPYLRGRAVKWGLETMPIAKLTKCQPMCFKCGLKWGRFQRAR